MAEQKKKDEKPPKQEEFSVSSEDLLQKIKDLIKEGNVRHIVIQNDQGKTLLEFPVTIGIVGLVLAPFMAAILAVAALATNLKIVVTRT